MSGCASACRYGSCQECDYAQEYEAAGFDRKLAAEERTAVELETIREVRAALRARDRAMPLDMEDAMMVLDRIEAEAKKRGGVCWHNDACDRERGHAGPHSSGPAGSYGE